MAIVGTLPVTLQNGTTADASQVMADLNFIANQVNANAVPASGASPTFAGLTVSGTSTFSNPVTISSSAQTSLTVTSSGASSYAHWTGSGGGKYLGVVGNSLAVANAANTVVLLTLDDSGNLTATGNITASSDERLKTDWEVLPPDFIERLSAVKCGTFTRISTRERSAGVTAQSLRGVLPEAVLEGPDGYLSVAYGNAALVACIELAKEVLRLRAMLEPEQ